MAEETPVVTERKKPGPKPKVDVPKMGRIVLYVTASGTARPAIISKIHDEKEQIVDLTVFNSEGSTAVTNVKHESPEQEWIEEWSDIAHSWHWPIR